MKDKHGFSSCLICHESASYEKPFTDTEIVKNFKKSEYSLDGLFTRSPKLKSVEPGRALLRSRSTCEPQRHFGNHLEAETNLDAGVKLSVTGTLHCIITSLKDS
ncbi:UNVERIFIED_CONTAM: hypothetical protein NCL1_44285 [Trichonephila clavipes]